MGGVILELQPLDPQAVPPPCQAVVLVIVLLKKLCMSCRRLFLQCRRTRNILWTQLKVTGVLLFVPAGMYESYQYLLMSYTYFWL